MGAHEARLGNDSGPDCFGRLRQHLNASRGLGLDFEQAWRRAAADRVLPPAGADRDVLEASRPAWRRAFYREPPGRLEAAVSRLADVLADEGGPEDGRAVVLT